MPDFFQLVQQWGWPLAIFYMLLRDVWPSAKKYVFTSQKAREKQVEADHDVTVKRVQRETELAAKELELEQRDRDFQHELQLRREENFEKLITEIRDLTKALSTTNQGVALTNERLTNMQQAQITHDKFTIDAVEAMHETIRRGSHVSQRGGDAPS